MLTKEKKFEEAVEYYQMALDSFRMSNNKQFIVQTNQLLGELYLEKQEWILAEQYLREALHIADEMNSVSQRGTDIP